jgi:hypothetical protein
VAQLALRLRRWLAFFRRHAVPPPRLRPSPTGDSNDQPKLTQSTAMKSLRLLASALLLATTAALAADRATELLAVHGSVPVKSAGRYVEVGTFQIQVGVKLGQPTVKLADGTWIYDNYQVDDSDAAGVLVVRFNRGRVSELSLVTPTIASAMTSSPKSNAKTLVAAKH